MAMTAHVDRATRLSQRCRWLMTFFSPSCPPYLGRLLSSFDERSALATPLRREHAVRPRRLQQL